MEYTYKVELRSDRGHTLELDVRAQSSVEAMARAEQELAGLLRDVSWLATWATSQSTIH